MTQYYPIVIPGGRSLAGDSLGFRAYSLRIDNLTNQWLLEETSLAWIPPYSLGVCLRLYGTGVAIILNRAPIGQPQLAPITGEETIGVYSDLVRTEVAGSPVRQFTLVQSVSDLTEGPQPALPPVGVDRLYADPQGNIHHLHSDGTDLTLVDPSNGGTLLYPSFDPHYQAMMLATALGGDLNGTVANGHLNAGVAAANVGALGGVLTGTLPAPGMAAGAAAANVGALGGVLTGTLPNPGLANNSVATANVQNFAIGTAQLALNAANSVPGVYGPAFPAFSTTTTATWLATPITASITSTGQWLRIAGYVNWQHSTTGGAGQFALYQDGASIGVIAFQHDALASGSLQFAFEVLTAPAAGAHTYTIYAYNFTAGTLSLSATGSCHLSVMEHKR